MTFTLQSIQSGPQPTPPLIIVVGVPGVGKSTFASQAPDAVFIKTEDGLGNLDVKSFPLATSWEDVNAQLDVLLNETHAFSTMVFDSLDWYERLIWDKVARDMKVPSIEGIPYGKGYAHAVDRWAEFYAKCVKLRDTKNMMIVFTAHSDVIAFDDPEKGRYSRYNIKLHKAASALSVEAVDAVFFANYDVVIKSDNLGFGNTKNRAMGSGTRFLYTQERPAYIAKNRYSLPEQIPLDARAWPLIATHVPFLNKFLNGTPTNENDKG